MLSTCEAPWLWGRPGVPRRLLEEEEEKLKQLLQLKEEHERYIERAQQEKQELQQEMAQQSRSLQQAQQQLEQVRQNRQRADEDVEVSPGWGRGAPPRAGSAAFSQTLTPPLPRCVTSGELPNLSELQVPHLGKGPVIASSED